MAASLPEGVDDTPTHGEVRRARILPLSGKSGGAVGVLSGSYFAWLGERSDELGSDAAAALLADMAWTAGIGRSHPAYRSGVVFSDEASLRERLTALARSDEAPEPREPPKVVFVYSGQGGRSAGTVEELYAGGPVIREVLDRCDAVFREECGTSLFDRMLGEYSAEDTDDLLWGRSVAYSLDCALTALWVSVGMNPSAIVGFAAGATGRVIDPDRLPDRTYWFGRGERDAAHDRCARTLRTGVSVPSSKSEQAARRGPRSPPHGRKRQRGKRPWCSSACRCPVRLDSPRRSPTPMRRVWGFLSPGCSRARSAAGSRCPSTPSSANATGSTVREYRLRSPGAVMAEKVPADWRSVSSRIGGQFSVE